MRKKLAIITGGSRGIGYETARTFLSEGFRLHLVGRDEQRLRKVQSELGTEMCQVSSVDLSDQGKVETWLQSLQEIPNAVILNAGIAKNKRFLSTSANDRETEFKINYLANATIIQYFLQRLNPHDSIIVVSSLTALLPFPGGSNYAATKAALNSLLNSLRIEERKRNIHIGQVFPGFVRTDMTESVESILPFHNAEEIAQEIWKTYKFKKKNSVPGALNQLNTAFARFAPGLFSDFLQFGMDNLPFKILPETK